MVLFIILDTLGSRSRGIIQAASALQLTNGRWPRHSSLSFLSTIIRISQAFVGDDTFLSTSSQFADKTPPVVVKGDYPHTLSRGNGQLVGKVRRKGALDDEDRLTSSSRSTRRVDRYRSSGINGT